MDFMEVLSMAGTLVLMLAVFAGAYFVSKFVAKKYSPQAGASKNLSIIESLLVGKDKSLLVVRAAERVFLIGSTSREFTFLSELNSEEFPISREKKPQNKDFRSTLRDVISRSGRSGEGENY